MEITVHNGHMVIRNITKIGQKNHWKTLLAKRNSGRKPKLSERDRRTLKGIVSKNNITAATKVTAELFIFETLFPQKESDEIFTNPASTV